MVSHCVYVGNYDDAVRFGQEALTIARTLDDRSIEVVATRFLGQTHVARGDFSEAAAFLERNAALEGDLRHERFGAPAIQSAVSGADLANVLSQLGRFDEAIGHAEAAVQTAEAADHPFTLYIGLFDLGRAHFRRGDLPRAVRVLERCLDLCRTRQFTFGIPLVAATLGAVYAVAGRADEALSLITGAVEEFRRRQDHTRPAFILLYAGTTCLSAGRTDEAASHAREALALTRRLGARGSEADALCLAGDVASTGGAEDAQGYYREALALAAELGMRPLVAHCHLGLGKLYQRTDRREQAREHLTTATTMYREMGIAVLAGAGGGAGPRCKLTLTDFGGPLSPRALRSPTPCAAPTPPSPPSSPSTASAAPASMSPTCARCWSRFGVPLGRGSWSGCRRCQLARRPMARRKRSKGDKPEGQQLPISFEATTPEPQPEERVLAFQLRPGDRVKDGAWQVAASPTGYLKGKMVTVRLRKMGDATVTDVKHGPAHERVAVRRRASDGTSTRL